MTDTDQINGQVARAIEARAQAPKLDDNDAPATVMEKLKLARAALDTTETVLIWLTMVRSTDRSVAFSAKFAAEDDFDKALVTAARNARDYSSAKERESEANLATMEKRAAARTLDLGLRSLEDGHYVARLCKESVDKLHSALILQMRSFTLESNLSR